MDDKNALLRRLLATELSSLKTDCAALSNDVRELVSVCEEDLKFMCDAVLRSCKEASRERDEAVRLYKLEEARRRDCLNQLHALKGNIRVVCRVRPMNHIDAQKGSKEIAVTRMSREIVRCEGKNFEFDEVFGPKHTNMNIFDEALPMVESVFEGFHACIFAYGQTGSGKTFTMSGTPTDRGVNYRAVERLFEMRDAMMASGMYSSITFYVSNVEIYNETVRDLLSSGDANELQIRQDLVTGVHLPGCTTVKADNSKAVWEVMEAGQKNRAQALTKMNSESSRSHSVFMVEVEAVEKAENTSVPAKIMRGKLILVDLAGSERLSKSGVSGERQREAQCINKSLSALGDVIAALGAKSGHVPFRNSKLTYLLQDSMSKQNKVMMIVQTAPTSYNIQESLCTLAFGARARAVELGRAEAKVAEVPVARSKPAVPAPPPPPPQQQPARDNAVKQQNDILIQKMNLEKKLLAMERALAEAEARASLAERSAASKEELLIKAEREKDEAVARLNAQLRASKKHTAIVETAAKKIQPLPYSQPNEEGPSSQRQRERERAATQVRARLEEQDRLHRERALEATPRRNAPMFTLSSTDSSGIPLPLPPPISASSTASIAPRRSESMFSKALPSRTIRFEDQAFETDSVSSSSSSTSSVRVTRRHQQLQSNSENSQQLKPRKLHANFSSLGSAPRSSLRPVQPNTHYEPARPRSVQSNFVSFSSAKPGFGSLGPASRVLGPANGQGARRF